MDPSDMPGFSNYIITRYLNINPLVKPITQCKRAMGDKKKVGYHGRCWKVGGCQLREQNQIAVMGCQPNLVKEIVWKMTNVRCLYGLEHGNPIDQYPLQCIDQLVDAIFRHELLRFNVNNQLDTPTLGSLQIIARNLRFKKCYVNFNTLGKLLYPLIFLLSIDGKGCGKIDWSLILKPILFLKKQKTNILKNENYER